MDKEKPRLARLTAILTQLQSKRIVTARDIAEKHKVSIRTIYRDIRTLEKSGIPIITEEGKGYSVLEGYKLPPIMFTEQEANALITAEKILAKNKDKSLAQQYNNAVEKIKSVLRASQKEKTELLAKRTYIKTSSEKKKANSFFTQLQTALTNYQLVELTYISLNNQLTKRTIEPFALVLNQDHWILIAFCRLRNDFMMFRLNGIQYLTIATEHFQPHKLTLQEYFKKRKKNL